MSERARDPDRLVPVGTIGSPHGLGGALHLWSETDPAESVFDYGPWILERRGERRPVTVLERGRAGGRLVVRLDVAATPEDARAWSGATLLVPRASFPPLPPGRYYLADLLGLEARDEDDAPLGTVERATDAPAQPLLAVRDGGRLRLCPFVWEAVVLAVDLERGTIRLRRDAFVD